LAQGTQFPSPGRWARTPLRTGLTPTHPERMGAPARNNLAASAPLLIIPPLFLYCFSIVPLLFLYC